MKNKWEQIHNYNYKCFGRSTEGGAECWVKIWMAQVCHTHVRITCRISEVLTIL